MAIFVKLGICYVLYKQREKKSTKWFVLVRHFFTAATLNFPRILHAFIKNALHCRELKPLQKVTLFRNIWNFWEMYASWERKAWFSDWNPVRGVSEVGSSVKLRQRFCRRICFTLSIWKDNIERANFTRYFTLQKQPPESFWRKKCS